MTVAHVVIWMTVMKVMMAWSKVNTSVILDKAQSIDSYPTT